MGLPELVGMAIAGNILLSDALRGLSNRRSAACLIGDLVNAMLDIIIIVLA